MSDASLYNTQAVLALLALRELAPDRYQGASLPTGQATIFGGQIVAQALAAAGRTVVEQRPHAVHTFFLAAGDPHRPVECQVERLRDGRSFATRQVNVLQGGQRIAMAQASFQRAEAGLSHQRPMPSVGPVDQLVPCAALWREQALAAGRPYFPVPVEFSTAGHDPYHNVAGAGRQQLWVRTPESLPDDPLIHEALFGYVSDYCLLFTALQPHGIGRGEPRLQNATLDHTIWFHRPLRMDRRVLIAMQSPNASGGRGLALAHAYDASGTLVATVAQEALIRLRAPPGGAA